MKFSFGSNGRYPNMGKLDYSIAMAKSLGFKQEICSCPARPARRPCGEEPDRLRGARRGRGACEARFSVPAGRHRLIRDVRPVAWVKAQSCDDSTPAAVAGDRHGVLVPVPSPWTSNRTLVASLSESCLVCQKSWARSWNGWPLYGRSFNRIDTE